MTNHERSTLVIVLGASGRLGRILLPHLLTQSRVVIGICRSKPPEMTAGMCWQQLDLTDQTCAQVTMKALAGRADTCDRLVIVDLALDKSSVSAMRRSIAAATDFVFHLADLLAHHRTPLSLVSASTTAVLAPWPYQTPYGLEKRRQLQRYAASGIPGGAFLLPSLTDTPSCKSAAGVNWTFGDAARQLTKGVHHCRRRLSIIAPREAAALPPPPASRMLRRVSRASRLLYRRAVATPDCPHTHRDASHALLALTPPKIRRHLDHHRAPEALLQALSRRLGIPVRRLAI